MGKRRDGREAAMQYLFAHDLHSSISDAERVAFWTLHTADASVRQDAESLVKEIVQRLPEIDEIITQHVQNFRMERLTGVDRNIMRLAVYELKFTEVPVPVVLDEAIEISKKYGTSESGGFVNGVLDRIARALPPERRARPDKRKPATETPPAGPSHGGDSTTLVP